MDVSSPNEGWTVAGGNFFQAQPVTFPESLLPCPLRAEGDPLSEHQACHCVTCSLLRLALPRSPLEPWLCAHSSVTRACTSSPRVAATCALSFPADVSRCVAERKYTQEQARKELQQVFIPECSDDGTYSQVSDTRAPCT